jgi:pyruvate/2-oxoglutarate dehydrogenase complex dihydrolipoamide acyltransferase (E2) component
LSAVVDNGNVLGIGRVTVERESVNDDSVIIRNLLVVDGSMVSAGQAVLEIETSKSIAEIAAPIGGTVRLRARLGDELQIGELMFEVLPDGAHPVMPDGSEVATMLSTPAAGAVPLMSLAAQRAARALELPLDSFAPGSWVTAQDVALAAHGVQPAPDTMAPEGRPARATPTPSVVFQAADASALQRLSKRKQSENRNLAIGNAHGSISTIGVSLKLSGPRLVQPAPLFRTSIADLLVFEGARLLRGYPLLNACWADERQVAVYEHVNFGISFDSGDNLKVLAIRRADTLGLPEIHAEFARLLDLYESGDRIDEELLGSATVTLSDLSGVPVSFMQPLINGRQSLILGVTRPAADRFDLFASFDHRVTEGLAVARFLVELSERASSHFGKAVAAGAVDLACSACKKPMAEELELGGRGFLDVTLGDGSKGMLCRNCLMGY